MTNPTNLKMKPNEHILCLQGKDRRFYGFDNGISKTFIEMNVCLYLRLYFFAFSNYHIEDSSIGTEGKPKRTFLTISVNRLQF